MNLEQLWQKALDKTEIKKHKLQNLYTFRPTDISYILLSESELNKKDTVVRKGRVSIDKPVVLLPGDFPEFKGFDLEQDIHTDSQAVNSFLFMRGIKFPSLSYNNELYSLDVIEKTVARSEKYHLDLLQRKEDINTGLVICPQDCWQLSLLIYTASLITKSASKDISNIVERMRNKNN